jgi:monoamine oxidase
MLDCVVVGAGAAGIGAGLALLRAKASFVILEAKDRVGGRAFTEAENLGHAWDQGCHWFHSASVNPLREVALKLAHPFVDQPVPYAAKMWVGGAWHGIESLYDAFGSVVAKAEARLALGGDFPMSDVLGATSEISALTRHEFALTTSHELEDISAEDMLSFEDTDENIPVAGGYGALIARLASWLPVQLAAVVTEIEVRGDCVRVHMGTGVVEARSVVITVPQRVLERQQITFSPRLPDTFMSAIADVPMGWFEKTAFAFDRSLFGSFVGSGVEILLQADGKAFPVAAGVFGASPPYVVCHTGGALARDLSEKDRFAICEDGLVQCFGSDMRKHIIKRATSSWTADPFIGGAYSCAKPGKSSARMVLRECLHERVFLAGEHTSLNAMATAHGAYVTGLEAAHKAMKKAGRAIEADPLWVPTASA